MAEPTNTDIIVALSRLDEKVAGLAVHLERSVERHGREIGDLRSEVRTLAAELNGPEGMGRRLAKVENAPTVTWVRLGALLAVLLPVISLIVAVFATF